MALALLAGMAVGGLSIAMIGSCVSPKGSSKKRK